MCVCVCIYDIQIYRLVFLSLCKKINRSHTHTHTDREQHPRHTRTRQGKHQTPKRTPSTHEQVDAEAVPDELKCPITKTLFRDPVVLPCCGASVSGDAVLQALIDDPSSDGTTCALCGTAGVKVTYIYVYRESEIDR